MGEEPAEEAWQREQQVAARHNSAQKDQYAVKHC